MVWIQFLSMLYEVTGLEKYLQEAVWQDRNPRQVCVTVRNSGQDTLQAGASDSQQSLLIY